MTAQTPVTMQPIQGSASFEDSRKRKYRFLWLLILLIPACLWLTAQVALVGLGVNQVEDTVLSSMAADYSQWQPQQFNPLKPELIGTIRSDQLTLVALPGADAFRTIVPFISFGTGTSIAEVPSATPTATTTPAPATMTPTPTSTLVIIWPPLWTDTPTTTATTAVTPPWTTIPPTPIPPTAAPQIDLAISKDDGITIATPGDPIRYTIVVTNNGPAVANGAVVTDMFPAEIVGGSVTWTCSTSLGSGCGASSGSGNINTSVNLLVGELATFVVDATISLSAAGTLSNTATVAPPSGMTDSNITNDRATDIDTLTGTADLEITKTNNRVKAWPGGSLSYTIDVINNGPSDVIGARVIDIFPGTLNGITWTCAAGGGASCTSPGAGNIDDTVDLPAGGTLRYTVTGTVDAAASGELINIATISPPGGITDPTPGNNSASHTDPIGLPELVITLTWGNSTNTIADIDLWVVEPSGFTISWYDPTSPSSGGNLNDDINCPILEGPPSTTVGNEFITWPPAAGAPLGTYEVMPHFYATCSSGWIDSVDWTITVTVDGTTLLIETGMLDSALPPDSPLLPAPITFTLN